MSIYNDPIDYGEYAPAENSYTMSCDNCGDELCDGHGFMLFEDMIEVAKRDGWRFTKDENEEWYHYCPSCAKKLNVRIGPSAAQDFEGVGSG